MQEREQRAAAVRQQFQAVFGAVQLLINGARCLLRDAVAQRAGGGAALELVDAFERVQAGQARRGVVAGLNI